MAEMSSVPGASGGMWSMGGPMWMPSQPPTLARLLAFHLQPVPILPVLALLALVAYLAGVVALRRGRSGPSWSPWRTASWVVALALVELVTTTGIEGYGMMIFSVHMAQHMLLALVVPILLALGAPVRLARAVLPTASAVRRTLDRIAASRLAAVLLSTPVRWALFLASLYGIYFTPLFGTLMHTVWGHTVMLVHFVLTGCLFFGPLIGARSDTARRLGAAFASAPLHAVFGLAILLAQHPVVRFFDHPAPGWGIGALSDQSLAGAIAWATSEAATVLAMIAITVQHVRQAPGTGLRFPSRAALYKL